MKNQITESKCGRDSETRKSNNRKEQVKKVLWVTVRGRAEWSMCGLFHVPCDGVLGGLEPLEGPGNEAHPPFSSLSSSYPSFLLPYLP